MIDNKRVRDALGTLEHLANQRGGAGTALRALSEVAGTELCDDDHGEMIQDVVINCIARLAEALVVTATAAATSRDPRTRQLLIDLVAITVGEGDDLAQMVGLQREARSILEDAG